MSVTLESFGRNVKNPIERALEEEFRAGAATEPDKVLEEADAKVAEYLKTLTDDQLEEAFGTLEKQLLAIEVGEQNDFVDAGHTIEQATEMIAHSMRRTNAELERRRAERAAEAAAAQAVVR